jgi:hypothetical protein
MSEIKDGGPAFPVPLNPGESYKPENHGPADGMTLRDFFAIKALPHALNSPHFMNFYDASLMAYEIADAMLRARGAA